MNLEDLKPGVDILFSLAIGGPKFNVMNVEWVGVCPDDQGVWVGGQISDTDGGSMPWCRRFTLDELELRPPDVVRWINVYGDRFGPTQHLSRKSADGDAVDGRKMVVEINMTARTCTWHEVER